MLFETVRPWLVLFPLLVTMIGTVCFVVVKRRARDILTFGFVGVALCLVVNLRDLQSLAFGPLSVEMRTVIDQANATIGQLRELAAAFAQPTLGTLQARARLVGSGIRAEQYRDKDRLIDGLKKLGLDESQLKSALAGFNGYVLSDLYMDAVAVFMSMQTYPAGHRGEALSCFNTMAPLHSPPDAIQEVNLTKTCLQKYGPIPEDLSDALDDVTFFAQTNELRRPQIYFSKG